MPIPQLSSRIDKVKIYAAGATVTRIANLNLSGNELPEQVEIAGLPLALDDSSVRVWVEAEQGNVPIAGDVRIGLAVPPPPEIQNPPPDEELRAAEFEVLKIKDAIALISNEIEVLYQLQVPDRPESEPGKAPPASPMNARLALANFSDEQIRARIQEKRETLEKLRKAEENLADLQQKRSLASTAKNVKPNELRKTVIVSLSYEGTSSSDQTTRLIVEYFVPGARWTPTYVCRLNSAESSATIAVRALISQRTGEDWSGVSLELSTANPAAWCELPELRSLRLGRAQIVPQKAGWRRPPIGANILFEDFDKQKEAALVALPKQPVFGDLPSSLGVPSLPNLVFIDSENQPTGNLSSLQRQVKRKIGTKAAFSVFSAIEERTGYYSRGEVTQDQDPTSQIPIEELHLSVRTYNCLKKTQINSVADLLNYTQEDLLEIENFGQKSAQEVIEALQRRLGITLPSRESLQDFSPNMLSLARVTEEAPESAQHRVRRKIDKESSTDILTYSLMRMGAADDRQKRGKLSIENRQEAYLEILQRQKVVVNFNVLEVVEKAVSDAENCFWTALPPGGINVREYAGSFDYAYNADGRIDVPSDGEFHSVALTSKSTEVDLRYVVVPREDTNVFRIAQLRNPLQAPLLSGAADIYVDGEYILSTNIATVPPKGQMELGLGVEQAIKVARNTFYQEVRSGETIVAFNELRHQIKIDVTNHLPKKAKIEVRERLPIPEENAKVDVQIDRVSPEWKKYKQTEREKPIKGGYRWQIQIPAKQQTTLSVDYTIKTFVDNELIGGNRREE